MLMKRARIVLCIIALGTGVAPAQEPYSPYRLVNFETVSRPARQGWQAMLDQLSGEWRTAVDRVIQRPTLTAQSPPDSFAINDELYRWMLDHPDRVALAWRRMRVPAVEITPLDNGSFSWRDDKGSELVWRTLARVPEGRLWYAEGKVRPGALLPLVPVRAVAVLRHEVQRSASGRTTVHHQVDAYMQTDSKFANLVTRLLGPAAPKMAEDGAEQMLYFFSGVARYLDEHPDKAPKLLAEKVRR
jgi:hypothetical protein